jgi:hypothetical protein
LNSDCSTPTEQYSKTKQRLEDSNKQVKAMEERPAASRHQAAHSSLLAPDAAQSYRS